MGKLTNGEREYQNTGAFLLKNFGELIVLKIIQDKPQYGSYIRLELSEMFGAPNKTLSSNTLLVTTKRLIMKGYANYYRIPIGKSTQPKHFKTMFEITNKGRQYMELKQAELDSLYWMIKNYGMTDEELRILEEIRKERLEWKPENETGIWNELNEASE